MADDFKRERQAAGQQARRNKVPDSLQVAFRILNGNRNGNQQDYRLMFQVKKGMKE